MMERLRKIAGVLSPEDIPEAHIIMVELYRGETAPKALARYRKKHKISEVIQNPIFINIPTAKQIRDRRA